MLCCAVRSLCVGGMQTTDSGRNTEGVCTCRRVILVRHGERLDAVHRGWYKRPDRGTPVDQFAIPLPPQALGVVPTAQAATPHDDAIDNEACTTAGSVFRVAQGVGSQLNPPLSLRGMCQGADTRAHLPRPVAVPPHMKAPRPVVFFTSPYLRYGFLECIACHAWRCVAVTLGVRRCLQTAVLLAGEDEATPLHVDHGLGETFIPRVARRMKTAPVCEELQSLVFGKHRRRYSIAAAGLMHYICDAL